MARSHGRCAKGERLRMGFPHGDRITTTLVAGLRMTGMVASMVLDGPINPVLSTYRGRQSKGATGSKPT